VPNQPKTPTTSFRIPREVVEKAREKARAEGTSLPAKVNEWMLDYIYEDED
jgi:hypothetical protein